MNRRAPNFTFAETEALIFNLEVRPELISNKLNESMKLQDHKAAWEQVAISVSSSGVQRSAAEVKKKWQDLKWRVKVKVEKIAEEKMKSVDDQSCSSSLSCLEDRVLALIRSACPPVNASSLCESSTPVFEEPLVLLSDVASDTVLQEQKEQQSEEHTENNGTQELKIKIVSTSSSLTKENAVANSPLPLRGIQAPSVTVIKDFPENGSTCRKRKLLDSDDDILKNILEMQRQLKQAHLQQIEEIRKMKDIFHRLVKLKEAKLKLKCIKYGMNYKAVLD